MEVNDEEQNINENIAVADRLRLKMLQHFKEMTTVNVLRTH